MNVRRLLVGPGASAARVGVPVVVVVAALTAVTTASALASMEGGVYFPLDAVVVGFVVAAGYAYRYDALAVCVAVGVVAFAGSDLGFHALSGDAGALGTLAAFLAEPEPVTIGAVVGGVGGVLGAVARRVAAAVAGRG